MTEKIKLTQEQAGRIEHFKEYGGKVSAVHQHFIGGWKNTINQCLSSLSDEQFISAVWVPDSYEVEQPQIYVGDWVTRIKSRRNIACPSDMAGVAIRASVVNGNRIVGSDGNAHHITILRHSTPEEIKVEQERQKWSEIGREVGEIFHGDIGIANSGQRILSKSEIEAAYKHGSLIGLYPNGSIVSFVEEVESIVEAPTY